MKYDYLIVGAGLFGAVFAHEAASKGKKCLVIDKRNNIAGNIYTAEEHGITVKREVMIAGKPQSALCVGDRIKVRTTIETTRDLDFVQVVDRRAACMEPIKQLSGYQNGAYVSPKDYATNYYYYGLAKGKHVIETEYYIDRAGCYETGTCSVGCAYAPEYRATAPSMTLNVK